MVGKYFKILIIAMMLSNVFYGREERNPNDIPLGVLWQKMLVALDVADSTTFYNGLLQSSVILTHSCEENRAYVSNIKSLIEINRIDSAKTFFVRMVLSSIVAEEIRLSEIQHAQLRVFKAKQLFSEIISIKFFVIRYDFSLYKYIINKLKLIAGGNYRLAKNKLPEIVQRKLLFTKTCFHE